MEMSKQRDNMTSLRIKIGNQKGLALFIALLIVIMLTILGLGLIKSSNDEISIAGNSINESVAFYAADAGLEKAASELKTHFDTTTILAADSSVTGVIEFDNATAAYVASSDTVATIKTITQGTFTGLYGLTTKYRVGSMGTSLVDGRQVTLVQEFQRFLVPIYQFAVFDHDTLFVALDAGNLWINGPVHANGPAFLQCKQELLFKDRFTASGDLIHGAVDRTQWFATVGQNIGFADGDLNIQPMYQDGQWLDATDPNWYSQASERWDGNVRDQAFSTENLNLPLRDPSDDAHKMIERAIDPSTGETNSDSYENQADLKIIDGVVYKKVSGSWQNITSTLSPGIITSGTFIDLNERDTVAVTDIDLKLLESSSAFPSNGIIYFSDSRFKSTNQLLAREKFSAARLINGGSLSSPLSVFCENPIYVKGDYNAADKQPASIVADAVTFLSNSWNDSQSGSLNVNDRVASSTSVNAAIITGERKHSVTVTGGETYYSPGALQDLFRFLEKWDAGPTFGYTGSIIDLWKSHEAVGTGIGGGYYRAYRFPSTFEIVFDTDFKDPHKLPPGTPAFQIFQKLGWKMQNVGYAPVETE